MSQIEATSQYAPGGVWPTRHDGLTMHTTGRNNVKEFTGMWPLKPDADVEAMQRGLLPGG